MKQAIGRDNSREGGKGDDGADFKQCDLPSSAESAESWQGLA